MNLTEISTPTIIAYLVSNLLFAGYLFYSWRKDPFNTEYLVKLFVSYLCADIVILFIVAKATNSPTSDVLKVLFWMFK